MPVVVVEPQGTVQLVALHNWNQKQTLLLIELAKTLATISRGGMSNKEIVNIMYNYVLGSCNQAFQWLLQNLTMQSGHKNKYQKNSTSAPATYIFSQVLSRISLGYALTPNLSGHLDPIAHSGIFLVSFIQLNQSLQTSLCLVIVQLRGNVTNGCHWTTLLNKVIHWTLDCLNAHSSNNVSSSLLLSSLNLKVMLK